MGHEYVSHEQSKKNDLSIAKSVGGVREEEGANFFNSKSESSVNHHVLETNVTP